MSDHNDVQPSTVDISSLQANFSKQQKKISALKDMVTQGKASSSAHEKVKALAQRLTIHKSKARSRCNPSTKKVTSEPTTIQDSVNLQKSTEQLQDLPDAELSLPNVKKSNETMHTPMQQTVNLHLPSSQYRSSTNSSLSSTTIVPGPGNEKLNLLRHKMEENRLRLTQRASSKHHLEQLVTQLKEKFDSAQQCLEDTTELGKSMTNLSIYSHPQETHDRHRSATDLSTQYFNLDKERIKFLENRCRLLEKQMEKERNTMSCEELSHRDQISAKRIKELENMVIDLKETLRTTVSTAENVENELPQTTIEQTRRIEELDVNTALDTARTDLTEKLATMESNWNHTLCDLENANKSLSNLRDELLSTQTRCNELEEKLNQSTPKDIDEIRTNYNVQEEMARQIGLLNAQLLQTQSENHNLEQTIEEMRKVTTTTQTETQKIDFLETMITSLKDDVNQRDQQMERLKEEVMEKTIELNVINANFKVLEQQLQTTNKPLFSSTTNHTNNDPEVGMELQQVKQKLEESNKAMIKMKLKCKQTQKELDRLQNITNIGDAVILYQKENAELQCRVAELEEEKGQWQLSHVDLAISNAISGNTSVIAPEISENEQERQATKQSNDSSRVESELSQIKLEECLEEQSQKFIELQAELEARHIEVLELKEQLDKSRQERLHLDQKLEQYMHENIELLGKVEKLSQSSSSAESIEIVELRRHSSQLANDQGDGETAIVVTSNVSDSNEGPLVLVNELTQTEIGPELCDSLLKLREESSELMSKIDLFTTERREVLEKMDQLTVENLELTQQIAVLKNEKANLESNALLVQSTHSELEQKVTDLVKENGFLTAQSRTQFSQGLNSLQQSSEVVAALDGSDGVALFTKCEVSLEKLSAELEAYRCASDMNAKFNASKKLAKEAKNAHTQLTELLQKVREASTAVETVTVVETVVAVTAPNGKALAEYEQLTAQNRELRADVALLRRKIEELTSDSRTSPFNSSSAIVEPSSIAIEPLEKKNVSQELLGTSNVKLEQSLMDEVDEYKVKVQELQSTVESLRIQLEEAMQNEKESDETVLLRSELTKHQQVSEDFDRILNETKATHEMEVAQLNQRNIELQGKCEIYEGKIDILEALIADQKEQLIDTCHEMEHTAKTNLIESQKRDEIISQLQTELDNVIRSTIANDKTFSDFKLENEQLQEALRIQKTVASQQVNELDNKQETIEMLNQQLIDLYKTIDANKVVETYEDDLAKLQCELNGKDAELENLRKDNMEQKAVVDKLLIELHSYRENTHLMTQVKNELEQQREKVKGQKDTIQHLEQRNRDLHDKLKKYAANLKKRVAQCQEYEAKIKNSEACCNVELKGLNDSNIELTTRIHQLEQTLQEYQVKLEKIEESEDLLRCQLQESLMSKQGEEYVEKDIIAKTQEIDSLKSRLENSEHSLNQVRQEMLLYQETVAALQKSKDQLQRKLDELEQQRHDEMMQYQAANAELNAKNLKFEKSKTIIRERNNLIVQLQAEIKDLQDASKENLESSQNDLKILADTQTEESYALLKRAYQQLQTDKCQEKATFESTIAHLEKLHDGIQAKLQEDLVYIETIELENIRFKEKICRLEQCVATFEERRASMEQRVHIMGEQLQTRVDEHERTEDALVFRLNMLAEHDDVIGRRLLESQEEKDELQERVDRLQQELQELRVEHSTMERDHQVYVSEMTSLADSEVTNLKTMVTAKTDEMQKLRSSYDAQLAVKTTELDELESELGEQLAKLNFDQRALQTQLEKARDNNTEQQNELLRLREELNTSEQARTELRREVSWLRIQSENYQQDQYEVQELRMQAIQDKTEQDNLRHQIESLAANHELEISGLRAQIAELETLRMEVGRNQTDDQVYFETENKRLTELLAEKITMIDNYQRQNLQLQMASVAPPVFVPVFDPDECERVQKSMTEKTQDQISEQRTIEDLQRNVSDLEKHAHDLENKLFIRNQSEAALEERLRATEVRWQMHKSDLHSQLNEAKLNEHVGADSVPAEMKQITDQELQKLRALVEQYRAELNELRMQLQQREDELRKLRNNPDTNHSAASDSAIFENTMNAQKQPSLDMFFGDTNNELNLMPDVTSAPVIEETIVPKHTYICHMDDIVKDEWEDVWNETKNCAEVVEHPLLKIVDQSSSALPSRQQELEGSLLEQQKKTFELEQALNRCEQQNKELQLKYGKLLKKMKEYKAKVMDKQLPGSDIRSSAKHSFVDTDLNAAIEDELKSQIKLLEARLSAEQKTQEVNASERARLLHRIEILTTNNDRINELRDSHDMEMNMHKARIQDLQERLQQLEDWNTDSIIGDDKEKESATVSTQTVADIDTACLDSTDYNVGLDRLRNAFCESQRSQQEEGNVVQTLQQRINQLEHELANASAITKEDFEKSVLSVNVAQLQQQLSSYQHELSVSNAQLQNLRLLCEEITQAKHDADSKYENLNVTLGAAQQELIELKKNTPPRTTSEPGTNSSVLSVTNCEADVLRAQLIEGEAEVAHLKRRIEELMREDQTEKLVLEILSKNQELQMVRQEVKHLEDEKQDLERILLESQKTNKQEEILAEKHRNSEMEAEIRILREERTQMEEELQVLNNHILGSLDDEKRLKEVLLQLDACNREIADLRQSLATSQADKLAVSQETAIQTALMETECVVTTPKDSEHPILKGFSSETMTSTPVFESLTPPSLSSAEEENTTETSTPLRTHSNYVIDYATAGHEATCQAEEANVIIARMQSALESQEMEIVSLKEQLAIRSAEYARLVAQYDPFKLQTTSSHSVASISDSSNPVTGKTELDLALYMLHQRNMRCEEMELELVSLMGERDTLQLKLSNTLRQLEDIRARGLDAKSDFNQPIEPTLLGKDTDETETMPATPADELTQKLSQLQTINHSMDKTIKEERQQRIWQMEQIQQDVARMPPAAIAELLGTDISQTTQSSTSAILSWLWGNRTVSPMSTPGNSNIK